MKYPNWSQVYANYPHKKSYNKQAKDITELTMSAIFNKDCIDNIRNELNLSCPHFGRNPGIHYLTQIGGNISMPYTSIMALMGFDSSPLSIRLHEVLFNNTDDVTPPSPMK